MFLHLRYKDITLFLIRCFLPAKQVFKRIQTINQVAYLAVLRLVTITQLVCFYNGRCDLSNCFLAALPRLLFFCNLTRKSYQVFIFLTCSILVSCSLILVLRCIQSLKPSFANWRFPHPLRYILQQKQKILSISLE